MLQYQWTDGEKPLLPPNKLWGPQVGTGGFWIKSLKSLDNLEGPFGNAGFWVGNIGCITAKIT